VGGWPALDSRVFDLPPIDALDDQLTPQTLLHLGVTSRGSFDPVDRTTMDRARKQHKSGVL
jgi:hypothetical protein